MSQMKQTSACVFKAICIAAWLLIPASASSQADDTALDSEIAQSDLHDLMTERISDSVMRMELLLLDKERSEAELEKARRHEAALIATAAAELQHSVDTILKLQPHLAPSQAEAPQFTALAKQLQTQAGALEELAHNNQYRALKPAVEEMKNTCNSCHHKFRGY